MRMRKAGDEERGCGFLRFLSPSRSSLFLLCTMKKVDSIRTHSTLHIPIESHLRMRTSYPCAAGTGVFSPQRLWWGSVRKCVDKPAEPRVEVAQTETDNLALVAVGAMPVPPFPFLPCILQYFAESLVLNLPSPTYTAPCL